MVILNFVVMGFCGGLAYAFLKAERWSDFKIYKTWRHPLIGLIVGYLYFFLFTDWGFPDMIMCFIAGYTGPSFLQGIVEKIRRD